MEERRGLNLAIDQVEEFHRVFDHHIGTHPKALDLQEKLFRKSLMMEELEEFMEANGDLTKQVDAMLDLMYFTLGTLVCMGVKDPQALFDEVHKTNMSKLFPDGKPHYREDGKVIKPEGFVAVDSKLTEMLNSME